MICGPQPKQKRADFMNNRARHHKRKTNEQHETKENIKKKMCNKFWR